jgi:hypothetical protein
MRLSGLGSVTVVKPSDAVTLKFHGVIGDGVEVKLPTGSKNAVCTYDLRLSVEDVEGPQLSEVKCACPSS